MKAGRDKNDSREFPHRVLLTNVFEHSFLQTFSILNAILASESQVNASRKERWISVEDLTVATTLQITYWDLNWVLFTTYSSEWQIHAICISKFGVTTKNYQSFAARCTTTRQPPGNHQATGQYFQYSHWAANWMPGMFPELVERYWWTGSFPPRQKYQNLILQPKADKTFDKA